MKQFFKKLLARIRGSAFLAIAALLFVGSGVAGMRLHSSVGALPASSNVEYFLKLDGIDGESNDKGHESEIELTSYAWSKDTPGVQQAGSPAGGGSGAGKAQVRDIHFTTPVNVSSPKLMEAVANNKHLSQAVLSARKSGEGQKDFLTIKLSDVRVSSYRTAGQNGGLPVDEFSLSFTKVEFAYAPQKPDGSSGVPVVGEWDFRD